MAFQLQQQGDLLYVTSDLLTAPELTHAFSTRQGGVSKAPWDSLNLGVGRGDDLKDVEENYRRFCAALEMPLERVVLTKQVHEDTVRIVTEADAGKGLYRQRDYTADAFLTDVPGLPLIAFGADCIVILLFDPVKRCVGAVHSGWRGTAQGILKKAAETMCRQYGSRPADIRAAIGPGIGACCFETDDDVPEALCAALGEEALTYMEKQGSKWHVDLKAVNAHWLRLAGVEQIDICPLCTACRPDLFWSHRKMGAARGGQVAAIALR